MHITLYNGRVLVNGKIVGYYARCEFGSFACGYMVEWDDGTTALADTEAFIKTLAKQKMS